MDGIGKVSVFTCCRVAVAVTCPDPGFGSNVNRNPSSSPTFYFGDGVTYSCVIGYKYSSGSMSRTCQLNSAFDGSSPACTIISCGSPMVGTGVSKLSGTVYTYNQVTSFGCNTGYTFLSGTSSRTCQTSAAWSGSTYTCERVNCGDPGTPTNGARTGADMKYTGILTFSCSTGYYLNNGGSTSRTCQFNAVWSGTQPVCSKMRCPDPGQIQNSTRVMNPTSSSFEYLDTVTYNPHTGYEIKSGSQTRTCQSSQTWSGTQPTVGRIVCPTLTRHNNATQTGFAYRYLDYVSWTCNTGYERTSGDYKVMCQSGRTWNGTVVQCRRITCPTLSPHNNASQTGIGFRYLDNVSWSCKTGYERDSGDYNVQCLSNRAWNGTVLQCKRITCSPAYTPHNNATQTGYAYRYLDFISWTCHSGYERNTGDYTIQCLSSRAWNGTQLTCKRITCPTWVAHNNVTQTGSSFRYLDYVSWTLHIGYERDSGDFNVQCLSTRAWNGTKLIAKRITCPSLSPHNNATQTGWAFHYLDNVNWACHTGYERDSGDYQVQCQASRVWNGTVLQCKQITCPTLISHNNATQTGFAYRFLDYVSWTCHTGYERDTGDYNVQCQANNAWNGTVLQCKRVTCPTPLYVSNSSLVGTDYKYLGVTTYVCDYGYEIKNGSETRACMAPLVTRNTYGASCPGWWNGTLPVCGRKECLAMTNPRGAHLVSNWHGSNINTLNFRFFYLDTIVWSCDPGLTRKAGDWVQTCLGTAVWNGTSPSCRGVDECRSNPCSSNALCLNLVNKYQCLCINRFSGSRCEIPPTISPNVARAGTNPFHLKRNLYRSTAGTLVLSHGSLLLVFVAVVWKHMLCSTASP